MAYTIYKSDGSVLTTIADGTINTTSTSLGLPGRNYAGYGQPVDTNFVHMVENFADTNPPSNPLRGQLWYDTNTSTLKLCPTDGETNAAAWATLTSTSSGGTTTFGNVTVTGNLSANNITVTNQITAANGVFNYLEVLISAQIANANIPNAVIGTTTTAAIRADLAGNNQTLATITGTYTLNGAGNVGNRAGTSLWLNSGNLVIAGSEPNIGIRTDKYYYANGDPVSFAGTYSNSNVQSYLPTYTGTVGNVTGSTGIGTTFRGTSLTTSANTIAGTITGNWTLTAGSRLNATYADLAERFEADAIYDPGTVVELGGVKEITAVKYELSDDVFGVISDSAGYIMNAGAGDDQTHPPVAVSGRVKVKVKGQVKKGDRLVSAGEGIARSALQKEATAFNTIGRSLEDKITKDIGYVEAIVIMK